MKRRHFLSLAAIPLLARAQQCSPQPVDFTAQYSLPWRTGGDAAGDCTSSAICYAMEMRGILTGQPVVQLSELDNYYQQRQTFGDIGTDQVGGLIGAAADLAALNGICAESLWPISIIGSGDYNQMLNGINTAPNAAAVADRPNHKLLNAAGGAGYFTSQSFPDQETMVTFIQANVTKRYPLCIFYPPNHTTCVWGFDANGVIGPDPRSPNPYPYHLDYDQMVPEMPILVVTDVQFAQPCGTTTPPPPPPPPAQTITYGQSLTDSTNAVWSILAAPRGELLLNGQSANGVWASSLTILPNGHLQFTNQDNGAHQCTPPGVAQWSNC